MKNLVVEQRRHLQIPLPLSYVNLLFFLLIEFIFCQHVVAQKQVQTEGVKIGIQKLTENIKRVRELQNVINKKYSEVELQLKSVEKDINKVQSNIERINRHIHEQERDLVKLESRRDELLAKKQIKIQKVSKIIRFFYMLRENLDLRSVFNQDYYRVVSRYHGYLLHIQKESLKVIYSYREDLHSIRRVEKQYQRQVSGLAKERVSMQQKMQTIAKYREARLEMVNTLDTQRAQSKSDIQEMEQQRDGLKKQLSKLNTSLSVGRSFQQMQGKLPWPIVGSLQFKFNQRKKDGQLRHQGIFVKARLGSDIIVIHDGQIVFSDWLRGYGLMVIVDHGDDYLTLYAHNMENLKKEGEQVTAGEVLAKSGDTGGIVEPGVYFELRYKGVPNDPQSWLVKQ